MLIGGKLVESESGEWIESLNPATEEVIGRVPSGSIKDVDKAVEAASQAQPEWAALPAGERGELLRALADGLMARAAELLELEVKDTGNTIAKMKRDVEKVANLQRYFAGLGLELKGETVPASPGNLHFTVCEPYGVVARIVPFNHPISFAAGRLAAPLMAGNSVIVKPPEQAPLSASILAEVCARVLPPGLVNIVTGTGPVAGDAIVRHPGIKRIAFIGSVPTGMRIQRAAAEVAVKHITLELGGKNPMIVFPDADLDAAVQGAVSGMNFTHQGQSCGSTSRLMLHDSIHDDFLARVVERVSALRVGDPMDEATDMGPMVSADQLAKTLHYIEAGIEDGARLMTGGARPGGPAFERGYWVRPTIFAGVTQDMLIAREEIFGPVLAVMRWKDEGEAVDMANATEYGLSAAIWTTDLKCALTTARQLRSGYVWINGTSAHYLGTPFGGMKNSGIGREEMLDELRSYTETKTVHVML